MDRDELIRRLMATFIEELDEHVRALERDALALEKGADGAARDALLKSVFRAVHSLKGAARSVDVRPVEEACHRLEAILAAVRDGARPLDAAILELVLALADAAGDAGKRLRAKRSLEGGPLAALAKRIEAFAAEKPAAASGEVGPAASAGGPRAAKAEKAPASAEGSHAAKPRGSRSDPAPPASPALPGRKAPVASPPSPATPPPRDAAPAPEPPPRAAPAATSPPEPPSERRERAPAAPPAPPAEPEDAGSVRISARKLDALLAASGELLLARRRLDARAAEVAGAREAAARCRAEVELVARPARGRRRRAAAPAAAAPVAGAEAAAASLSRLEKRLERLEADVAADLGALGRSARALDDDVRRARMLPFATACEGLERAVRDLARGAGKEAALAIEGGAVELDRSILERLRDPLRHLVRNAVDHGIEPPAAREAAGKARAGRISVAAVLRGAEVEVSVADDGAGVDAREVRRRAAAEGHVAPEDARGLLRLLFLPGFSTAREVTEVSGRGVGLDVVQSEVEGMHGRIDLESREGGGVRVALTLPLTLTLIRGVLVEAGGETFALPGASVVRLARVGAGEVLEIGGGEAIAGGPGGAPVPLVSLAAALGLAEGRAPEAAEGPGGARRVAAVVLAAGERRAAFSVDALLDEQELVVKRLGRRLEGLPALAGACVLPTGRVALVLSPAELVRVALGGVAAARPVAASLATPAVAERRRRVIVADDSLTTRALEKSILEAAGYEVAAAVDGADAWRLLQETGADLVVSDVEMPRMDGFALCAAIRGSRRFAKLPVILVTALESDADRARGLAAGADAYIGKGGFDQRALLSAVEELI